MSIQFSDSTLARLTRLRDAMGREASYWYAAAMLQGEQHRVDCYTRARAALAKRHALVWQIAQCEMEQEEYAV